MGTVAWVLRCGGSFLGVVLTASPSRADEAADVAGLRKVVALQQAQLERQGELLQKLLGQVAVLQEAAKYVPSPPNIFANSDFLAYDPTTRVPAGWDAYALGSAKVELESVHRFTGGFVGLYAPTRCASCVDPADADRATEESPVWWSTYFTGPRIGRDGWHQAEFRILRLRISGGGGYAVASSHAHKTIHGPGSTYKARAYVKFLKGSSFGMSQDVVASDLTVSRETCDRSPQRWCLVEGRFGGSSTDNKYLSIGRPSSSTEDLDVLVALPYIYSENATWANAAQVEK